MKKSWQWWKEHTPQYFHKFAMSRRQRVIMAVFLLGSFVYIILTQERVVRTQGPTEFELALRKRRAVHMLGRVPGEPTHPEVRKFCSGLAKQNPNLVQAENESSPVIYVVTPTYKRPEMVAELTRLGQTLTMVQRIHWIVAEDSATCSAPITSLLKRLGLPYTHLATPMPEIYRREKFVPRGVSNRRAALQWVQANGENTGVLFFLDDDNAVDIRLFEEMRSTKTVSMWPVGLIGEYTVSSPIVKEGKVVGFYDGWPAGRKFQVDMAGFAVGVGYMKKQRKVTMPYIAGHEEDGFLKSLNLSISNIEVKADRCTNILVWHTRTAKNPIRTLNMETHQNDNIKVLADNMRHLGMIK
ncbi:galactosylgalactosylxylosylprotein 3-beta-glucuronosyltransferase S-like isoform X3 [Homarus americanus]|uniref:galactosylgalactosylxylosylprotein 3-beta-glucuronosyltransferase S-like isoform X3 n=1 Tax=Homarus americanus TaxID=6706 RepID=UPI001C483E26|nr:galactosylgalactosylxylosylprotein 3-beta-glucuronosyltransferase S-like isoform X3 [Homarus americanus]